MIDPKHEPGQGSGITEVISLSGSQLPVPALFAASDQVGMRFIEFFTANIRNPNTRRAYYNATCRFASWCEARGFGDLRRILPVHVAVYVEEMQRSQSRPSVKQHLAAIRMLMDWLVVGQVIPFNPAASVRGPRYQIKKEKTPVLSAEEARTLLDSIETTSVIGLRDRALIALIAYPFACVGAAGCGSRTSNVQGRRAWVRLHEKGGKRNDIPAHHNLADYLEQYIADDRKGPLFRGARGRGAARPIRCLSHDPSPGEDRRHLGRVWLSHHPRNRHHGVFEKWRTAGNRPTDGRARIGADYRPL
jgi:site-specific recombinase XerC